MTTPRVRARDLGITIGPFPTGAHNAITDVAGVLVGHATIIRGEGPLAVGVGPVRTGVTVIRPHGGDMGSDPVFGAHHVFNGKGELTGTIWLEESGLLCSPIALTNTYSVGVVRDALLAHTGDGQPGFTYNQPVVGETNDGGLNDIRGQHVTRHDVARAFAAARGGPVAEGNVGGGTGMICHEFKGGIGTSSRVVTINGDDWTVGVLVQANYGESEHLRIDGVPAGRMIPVSEVPAPATPDPAPPGSGSIIIVVATDAPLLAGQCRRLAQRATVGLARVGGNGNDGSGDIFLAFSTANRPLPRPGVPEEARGGAEFLPNAAMSPLFAAVADATEEAIINALFMAETMTGVDGRVAHALPLDRVREIMAGAVGR